jgi:hypothetical protein
MFAGYGDMSVWTACMILSEHVAPIILYGIVLLHILVLLYLGLTVQL